jgi:hypothetical protein
MGQRMQVVHNEDERLFKPPGQMLQIGEGAGEFVADSHGEPGGKAAEHPAWLCLTLTRPVPCHCRGPLRRPLRQESRFAGPGRCDHESQPHVGGAAKVRHQAGAHQAGGFRPFHAIPLLCACHTVLLPRKDWVPAWLIV